MKTENLDAEIARLELEKKHNLLDEMQKSKLSEFKAIKEALSMPRVVQQRELLQAFAAYLNVEYCYSVDLDDDDVEQFLNSLQ